MDAATLLYFLGASVARSIRRWRCFLPQFVTSDTQGFPLRMLLLGFIFMVQAVIIFCLIGYFSGGIGSFLRARRGIAKYFDWLTAGVFASLGVKLALAER